MTVYAGSGEHWARLAGDERFNWSLRQMDETPELPLDGIEQITRVHRFVHWLNLRGRMRWTLGALTEVLSQPELYRSDWAQFIEMEEREGVQ